MPSFIAITSREKGFTLIELMISISILTLLLFTGSYTYSLMSERWNKELGQFSQSAQLAKNIEILQRALEGIHSFVVVDKKGKPSLFFIGDSDSLLSISRSGFYSNGFPEIFRISTVKNEHGLFDLVYQAASSQHLLLTGTDQEIEFDHQITLFKDIEEATFTYYGWSSYAKKSFRAETADQANWSPRFSGIDNQIMPEKFQLTLKRLGKDLVIPIILEQNSERWLSPYIGSQE
jgi:prepilin-type N-terminal cleavage/methylation domain-containing protein